jgi:NitT/TauT family transport system substrate-binding protein
MPAKKFRVLLAFPAGITYFSVSLADQLGYFRQEGIETDIQVVAGSGALMQQLATGNAEIGVSLAPSVLLGASEGVRLKVFYDVMNRNSFDLWVLDGSPIRSLPDLKGKNIGVGDVSRGDAPILRAQLQKIGLDPQRDVNIVPLGVANRALAAEALRDGKVDAHNTAYSALATIQALLEASGVTLRCLTCDNEQLQLASEVIVVPNAVYQRDRQYMIGFGRALAKATVFAQANPDAALAVLKNVNPQEQTDPAIAKRAFLSMLEGKGRPRQPGKYGSSDLGSWDRLQEFMAAPSEIQATGLKGRVNVSEVVTNELVEDMNRFDVAAVEQQAHGWQP